MALENREQIDDSLHLLVCLVGEEEGEQVNSG